MGLFENEVGAVFGAVAKHVGLWSLNPGRILYVVDDPAPAERWGFGFGTLPGHAESGEERFTASFDHERELVRYDAPCGHGGVVRRLIGSCT